MARALVIIGYLLGLTAGAVPAWAGRRMIR